MSVVRTPTASPLDPVAPSHGLLPLASFLLVAGALTPGIVLLATGVFAAGAGPTALAVVAFAVSVACAGLGLRLTYPHAQLGLCNVITLVRLALTTSLVAPLASDAPASWAVFAVALIALCLDGLDGWLARWQGHVSGFGARFDMEVDSLLALVLALSAAFVSGLGPVAVLLGVPRYAFAGAARVLPWMRGELLERFSRKVVCVLQLGVLIALQAPVLPAGLGGVLVAVATVALVWSFAVDVVWLWRQRP